MNMLRTALSFACCLTIAGNAEAGTPIPELDLGTWWGLAGPADMPRDVVARLAQAVKAAAETTAVREKLALLIQSQNDRPRRLGRG